MSSDFPPRRRSGPAQRGRLTHRQKGVLCKLAREAYDALDELDLTDGEPFDVWRRGQQLLACKKQSLTEARQADYLPLRAHFLTLLGRDDEAFDALMRSGQNNEDRRLALHTLEKACREASAKGRALHFPEYPAEAARQRFGARSLDACSVAQLWNLIYSVNSLKSQNV